MIDSYPGVAHKNEADHDTDEAAEREVAVFRNTVLRDHGSQPHSLPNVRGDPEHLGPIVGRLTEVSNLLKRRRYS